VWVAVMTAPQIWHVRDIRKEDLKKVMPLEWKQPFAAVWRVDWHRTDRLADSWQMVTECPDGTFLKYAWFRETETIPADRSRWATSLGDFFYPCWIDKNGRGNLQPQHFRRHAHYEGPTLIYPIMRMDSTPLDAYTVVDVVRATLGVGPCQYILDVEGQQAHSTGIPTCGCRETLMPIYEQHQQAQRKAEIEQALTDVMTFVRFIRSRVESYVTWGHDLSKYLADYRQAHPELAAQVGELERLTQAIDERYNALKDAIKTPDQTQELVDAFRAAHLTDETPQAVEKCKEFTSALVVIGGSQDELAGECRQAVRVLRQQAGIAVAMDARMAEVSREVRKRSQEILRSPAVHEWPTY
jgi:CHASE3 domain sensor protein